MKQIDLQGNVWDCSVGNIEPPISAYGSINLDEFNQVIKRLNKVPNYDELIKDNCKKDKQLDKYKNAFDKIKEYIEKNVICMKNGKLLTELDVNKILELLEEVEKNENK